MEKTTLLTLALLAAPTLALAAASPQVAVHQTQRPVPSMWVLDKFRVAWVLPTEVILKSVDGPHITIKAYVGARTAMSFHRGERIGIRIPKGRP